MLALIEEGADIILAISIEFVPYVGEVAINHPNVFFVIPLPFPPYFEMSNVFAVSVAFYESAYLNGYMAGAMATKSGYDTVGIIGALDDVFIEYQSVNAYYFGYQDACSQFNTSDTLDDEKQFLHIWSDSYTE